MSRAVASRSRPLFFESSTPTAHSHPSCLSMLQFATPLQSLHPLEYGSLPMTSCMHGPLARHGAWSGLQVQPVATAHVCVDAVHSVQPQRGSQTPLTSAAPPCGGFISTPPASSFFAAKDSVVAGSHQASKKKGNEERVYSIEQFRSMLCSVLRGAGAQGSGAEAVAAASRFCQIALPERLAIWHAPTQKECGNGQNSQS